LTTFGLAGFIDGYIRVKRDCQGKGKNKRQEGKKPSKFEGFSGEDYVQKGRSKAPRVSENPEKKNEAPWGFPTCLKKGEGAQSPIEGGKKGKAPPNYIERLG